jgi:FAD:protein FMN transferase
MEIQDLKEYTYSARLMDSTFEVSIISKTKEKADKAFEKILEMGRKYEQIFSRFNPDSELSTLNKKKEIIASVLFIKVMEVVKKLYRLTNKTFNPLFQIKNLGYDKSFDDLSKFNIEIKKTKSNFNFDKVTIDKKTKKIVLGKDQELDFGGFLKGYVAQLMCEELSKFEGSIVNIGGDLYTKGRDENGEKFKFNIYNPITKDNKYCLELEDSGMATSGTYKRKWKSGDKEYFHILDHTGLQNPDKDIISATIINAKGEICEAFATISIMLGSEKITPILKENRLKFVLIKTDGQIVSNI